MLATRNTPAFRPASMLLYGAVEPALLADAHAILARLTASASRAAKAVGAAEDRRGRARRWSTATARSTPASTPRSRCATTSPGLMVSGGKLMVWIATRRCRRTGSTRLLAHEVSVHLLTYFNGAAQGLAIFRTGLAGYEGIQEGLGVFAEWAVGGLTRDPAAPARRRAWSRSTRCCAAPTSSTSTACCADDHGFSRARRLRRSPRACSARAASPRTPSTAGIPRGGRPGRRRARRSTPFWLGKIAPAHVAGDRGTAAARTGSRRRASPRIPRAGRRASADRRACARPRLRPTCSQELNRVLIAFFVNDMEREYPGYTTTVLAHQAATRGHRVCYITPSDFVLQPDDSLCVHGRFLPKQQVQGPRRILRGAEGSKDARSSAIDMAEVDVLMLRNDPSLDAQTTPWAVEAGILFGREAAKRGVIVLNDPDSLGRAINKLYFQSFPSEARAETLITKHERRHQGVRQGAQGQHHPEAAAGIGRVGRVQARRRRRKSNLNQMIEAIGRDGYIIAQAYVPAAKKGDIRLFLMNGRPLADRRQICRAAPGRRQGRHPLQHPCRRQGRSGRDRRDRAAGRRDRSGPSWSPTACSWSGSTSSATRSWR